MAPERLQNQDYDGRSDIYSVGIMFYQMLSGAPPFDNDFEGIFAVALRHISETPESLCEIDPNIPKDVESLVMQALKKDYRERPTAEEMVREMTYLLHNLPEEKLNYIKPGRMSFPVDGAATIKQKVGWNRR
jgi:serine/threonine-protein kinase